MRALHADAADAAWPKLAARERSALLDDLQPLIAGRRDALNQRVKRLEGLPKEEYRLYQQLTAAVREKERRALLDITRGEIEQRIITGALQRALRQHESDPETAGPDESGRLLKELGDEEWASAVEQERLARIQRLSALRYGRPVDEVEVGIRRRLGRSVALTGDGAEEVPE